MNAIQIVAKRTFILAKALICLIIFIRHINVTAMS